jgi:nucleotidyltransferase substrate binding protein (TIGR01987 family)
METIKSRYEVLRKTLKTLESAIQLLENPKYAEVYVSLRDSAIQRLEYSIDTFWKFLKIYMQDELKIDIALASPRAILRKAVDAKIFSDDLHAILIDCLADRNLTSHSYNEELAEEIITNIPRYYTAMHNVLDSLKLSE